MEFLAKRKSTVTAASLCAVAFNKVKQAITWGNVAQDHCRQMASLGLNELKYLFRAVVMEACPYMHSMWY